MNKPANFNVGDIISYLWADPRIKDDYLYSLVTKVDKEHTFIIHYFSRKSNDDKHEWRINFYNNFELYTSSMSAIASEEPL